MRALALVLILACGCGPTLVFGGAGIAGAGIGYAHAQPADRTKDAAIGGAVGVSTVLATWLMIKGFEKLFDGMFKDKCWNVGQGCQLEAPRRGHLLAKGGR